MAGKNISWALLLPLVLFAAGCGRTASVAPVPPPQAPAPPEAEKGFTQSFPFEAPNFNLKKMEISGKTDASSLTENGLRIRDALIHTYRLATNSAGRVTNNPELTISAPECVLDLQNKQANSAGPLQVQTADGRFQIEGTGFLWQQKGTNAILTISNNVATTVKRGLLAANAASPEGGGQEVHVHSDSLYFDREANLITYQGHVRVDDEQLDMNCDTLSIHQAPSGGVSDLVADGNIVVLDKSNGGRTTGDHAVYTGTEGAQQVTLTGHPHWQNGPSDATAREFVFDNAKRTFEARGDAHAKLPPGSLSGTGFALVPATQPAGAPDSAARLVDIYAGDIKLRLPKTNGPAEEVIAERNVVIEDPQSAARATGDRADYTRDDGLLTLSGSAQLESPQLTARAETLRLDRTNRAFAALTNAYLRVPITTLGHSSGMGNISALNATSSNQFVEVTSDTYDFSDNTLTFHENVRARLRDGETPLGTAESGMLAVHWRNVFLPDGRQTNQLAGVIAERGVKATQLPTTANGKTTEGAFAAERAEMTWRTNGLMESANATGGVHASRTETSVKSATPIHLTLDAREFSASFKPDTNQVDVLTANHQVLLTRDETRATGDHIVYTATNDTAVLTGNPEVRRPQGDQITADDAILFKVHQQQFETRGGTTIDFPIHLLSQSNLQELPGKKLK